MKEVLMNNPRPGNIMVSKPELRIYAIVLQSVCGGSVLHDNTPNCGTEFIVKYELLSHKNIIVLNIIEIYDETKSSFLNN